MKTQQTERWDDIVFENRNKMYGAYAIRQRYPATILRALILCSVAMAGVFFLPSRSSIRKIKDSIIRDIPVGPVHQPRVKQNTPRPADVVPIKKTNSALVPTRVTTSDVQDEKHQDIPVEITSSGNPEGTAIQIPAVPGSSVEPIEVAPVTTPPFVLGAEVMPVYEGGFPAMMRFIQNKMQHSLRVDIAGTVYVSFVVSTTGAVTHVELVKGFDRNCDQEAMRVIALMDKWKPGMQHNVPVAVRMVLPIKFMAIE